ncbi:DUF389 domain-containing protein [filamentous cyanobacterium LEGE 11480]|uniref:DUF389 domain-containing protein n=1 Tax=Romeriopsis navalis LEGE 11480 TaxID=2777977 RepID=A0A928VRW1_9CYAN|nr:DUF389 domain-containing protein [Romeriopsis navalis]MBE9031435.1 DUF389 domain-containing protein [Romeriopsis navalis LEGE 11480]
MNPETQHEGEQIITHASPHHHRISKHIRSGAVLSWDFVLMNMLATVIASYGLLANSPAVVIGAMVVAILLNPIAAAALGIVEGDNKLVQRAGCTMFVGVLSVYITAFLIGYIHRDQLMTHEIMSRTAPTATDLMIALAGGAAGAIAMSSESLGAGLVGVAIATALVPPLASSAILIAQGQISSGLGALLLACANIVAIQFATSIVLWSKGFHRPAPKPGLRQFFFRNQFNIILLATLAVFLTLNLRTIAAKELFQVKSRQIIKETVTTRTGYAIDSVRFSGLDSNRPIIYAVIRGPNPLTRKDVEQLEVKLPKAPNNRQSNLRVQFIKTITVDDEAGELYKNRDFDGSRNFAPPADSKSPPPSIAPPKSEPSTVAPLKPTLQTSDQEVEAE